MHTKPIRFLYRPLSATPIPKYTNIVAFIVYRNLTFLAFCLTFLDYFAYMSLNQKKYRLRIDQRIVGYAEQTKHGLLFRGQEALWWMRGQPNYNQVDEAVGIKDCLEREIFELDIISYRINDKQAYRKGVVLWEKQMEQFGIYDIDSKHFCNFYFHDLCIFVTDKVQIISHLFNHPELETALGLENL